ncbi:MAG: 50S ribosomal protein L18 [Anaerolineales bacterium]|jgi:large subunit ribosomal protein L18|nr:50S ribosomal protein L18 [Anaerolineales bacterium]MDP7643705.1 50S ribosomal protein L18 [Anaerolineales bacterium]HJN41892.1 50S ribosomal protein L18 [Anaerolineales bacterium]
MTAKTRADARKWRHRRVRRKVHGTEKCPRLNVFRSSIHIRAQLIDDEHGQTLAQASTLQAEVAAQAGDGGQIEKARAVGAAVAGRAQAKGIRQVVFDRGGHRYHGRVKALAEAARAGGLEF